MDYHIIQGKPALTSQATLIRFQQAAGKIKYIERTEKKVTIEFHHEQAGNLTVEWTLERAKQAGLGVDKDNWRKYPTQMLTARCLAEGVRAYTLLVWAAFMSLKKFKSLTINQLKKRN